jgi:hypothetical protein
MRTAEEGRFNLLRGEFGDAYGEQKSDGSNNEVQPKMAPNWVWQDETENAARPHWRFAVIRWFAGVAVALAKSRRVVADDASAG